MVLPSMKSFLANTELLPGVVGLGLLKLELEQGKKQQHPNDDEQLLPGG